jgi:hypothetical protein
MSQRDNINNKSYLFSLIINFYFITKLKIGNNNIIVK